MKKHAIVMFKSEPWFREQLAETLAGYDVLFNETNDASEITDDVLADTRILFGWPRAATIKRCPKLEWLQLLSAGADWYDPALFGESVAVTNASGAYGHAISEHMVALVFSIYKKLNLYRDLQHAREWRTEGEVKSVSGATVLVVGMGDIGGQFARRMKSLGCHVIGLRRSNAEKPDYVDELVLADKLDDVLPRADIVALSLPGSAATKNLFDARRLALMKRGAVLINVGRGSAVDTDALCNALESGALLGAGLDVTDPEPLPADHRLWELPNAVITPHVSGGFYMYETYRNVLDISLDNAARFVRGEPLMNVVDFATGYRKPGEHWAKQQ